MSDVDSLRGQAERCLRLARAITNPDVIARLETIARELEAEALEVERAPPVPRE